MHQSTLNLATPASVSREALDTHNAEIQTKTQTPLLTPTSENDVALFFFTLLVIPPIMVPRAPHPASQAGMNGGADGVGGYGHHHHHHHAAAAYRAGMSHRLSGGGGGPSAGPSRHSMMDYTSAYRGPPTQAPPGLMGPTHSAAAAGLPPPQASPYADAPSSSHHLTSLTALLNSSTTGGCCKFEEEMDTSSSLLGGTGMAPPCVTLDEVSLTGSHFELFSFHLDLISSIPSLSAVSSGIKLFNYHFY